MSDTLCFDVKLGIMGKKKSNHRPQKKDPPSVRRTEQGDSVVATAESTIARSSLIHHPKSSASLPLPFPPGLPLPKDAFLCNTEPYKKSFQAAIDTCYEGFAVDLQINDVTEAQVQTALLDLERQGFFRTDVTQPFGLGTKCAKTYVTRCLLGDEGTTYKYLGLRMFSTPWNLPSTEKKPEKSSGVQTIQHLNQALTRRTENHLARLAQKRCQRRGHEETTRGRAGFDICLVNRMTHSAELKEEPSMKRGKCAVSWHADSSLEHYSTIAVYHTIMSNDSSNTSDNLANDWSVALRVAHHCEGPEASRRGTNIQSTLVTEAPSLSVSLPSGSTYYLLDDFNHHHQHAVVSQPHGRSSESTNRSVRYSCTHRLLRESHNVMYILERCQKACSMFHKKGSKLWRSEQLLLNDIESEWIRQFYVQGQQHYDLLWKHWGDSIRRLLKYWSQLESRTEQTIRLLQFAAEANCAIGGGDGPPPTKKERKLRDKRKKALDTVEDLLSRGSIARSEAMTHLYDPLAELLRERSEMRRLWRKREADSVFREMDQTQRPLRIPFEFGADQQTGGGDDPAASPLPEDLTEVADALNLLGEAYVSGDKRSLPRAILPDKNHSRPSSEQMTTQTSEIRMDAHCQNSSWEGWKRHQFGLEMQAPWARQLLQKRKTIETRAYELPPALLGKRIEVLQSQKGKVVSSLGNVVQVTAEKDSPVTRLGWCTFAKCIQYTDAASFDANQDSHCVARDSDFYPFKEGGERKVVYGWVVDKVGSYVSKPCSTKLNKITRRYRSLFELHFDESSTTIAKTSSRQRKKRRHY